MFKQNTMLLNDNDILNLLHVPNLKIFSQNISTF